MMAPRDNVIWLTQQLPSASVSGKASTHENSTFHFHTSRADAQMRGFRFRLRAPCPQELSRNSGRTKTVPSTELAFASDLGLSAGSKGTLPTEPRAATLPGAGVSTRGVLGGPEEELVCQVRGCDALSSESLRQVASVEDPDEKRRRAAVLVQVTEGVTNGNIPSGPPEVLPVGDHNWK